MLRLSRRRRRRPMTFLARSRRRLQQLTPYFSLGLLLMPLLFVEPLKIVALFVAGNGHWLTGSVMLLAAYAVSLVFIERLFVVLKPKLMTLHWFRRYWTWFATLRDMGLKWASGRARAAFLKVT